MLGLNFRNQIFKIHFTVDKFLLTTSTNQSGFQRLLQSGICLSVRFRTNTTDSPITSKKSITDQPAIFIAPEIYGTRDSSGATIPGFEIFPTGKETLCLIKQTTDYFNLTALIEFDRDEISQDDVQALKAEFATRPINQPDKLIYQKFPGCDLKIKLLSSLFSHLRPTSNYVKPLASCIAKMLNELTKRANSDYEPQKVKCEDYS